MKNIFLLFTVILVCTLSNGYSQNIEGFLRPYADAIVQETAFEFTDKETGEKFASTKNLPVKPNLIIESEFLHWRYTSALVYDGLRELGLELNEEKYTNFGDRAFTFFFDNKNYLADLKSNGYTIEGLENFMRFAGVWNDGAQTAAMVKVYRKDQRADYLEYMKQVANFFFDYEKREAENSAKQRRNKNIDQLYTKGVFMARMGKLTGEVKYFDYSVKEVLETDSLFYDTMTGLYSQYYYPNLNVTNNIKWLRGMGWAAIGIVNILSELPEDHPGYERVLNAFQKMVIRISAYQTKSGLWRHLVDKADCFEETSGSTYIVYAIAKGINEGFLDPGYRDVAMAGWQGIVSMQDANGKIKNVTSGVSGSTSPTYYYNNSIEESDSHLYGPLFLAGTEMIKLYKTYDKPKVRGWQLNLME
ncbi:MAG: glycoside hydrolase family 88 protein [Cyclobacteriaceae bacterium]|nr:glycoside hydrolase family 88 protein [Cyclobacteriaceae bacterium]MCK5280689.1 glycoside hydrolase family 88 protein [Cyclobacteriaceae bacterium]MCK5469565.1 glycoside hydrolase family 88 protein [Cyclobacteriaceae bacterium]